LPFLWFRSKKSRPKQFSALCAHPWAFSEPMLRKTCDRIGCDNLVEKNAWNLWKFTRNLWNCEAPSYTNFFCQHSEQDHHSLQMAGRHLCSSSWTFVRPPIFEHFKQLSYSSFTSPRIIHDDFRNTQVLVVKKVDNSALCDGLQGNESCDATSHARALSRSCISCLK
jgi:hypothetical protein